VEIVESYDTGVTLRQLFYRLVAATLIVNKLSEYKQLSKYTARWRRDGMFPDLVDRTRAIHGGPGATVTPRQALEEAVDYYDRATDEGQPWAVFVASEKATMIEQLTDWVRPYGARVVAVSGYGSQTYVDEVAGVAEWVRERGQRLALLYLGDYDPSGEDIDRDFLARCGTAWDEVHRLALTREMVDEYALPRAEGKPKDSRAKAFLRRHGELVQVELEALPPDVLQVIVVDAVERYWDAGIRAEVERARDVERDRLRAFVDTYPDAA
jgi:hypothetical protein